MSIEPSLPIGANVNGPVHAGTLSSVQDCITKVKFDATNPDPCRST